MITRRAASPAIAALFACGFGACGDVAHLPFESSVGPSPILPSPTRTLLPTVKIAPARGWLGAKPTPGAGLAVNAFATGLDHPRGLYVLPNGDVIVAETNAPRRPDDGAGIKGWVTKMVMARAGAAAPSANRITLLRDGDGDGVAETRTVFLRDLNSPFGMTLIGDALFVANTDAIVRFKYENGDTQIEGNGVKVTDLPAGPINHHWTKGLIASADGRLLFASVGSNSNVAENGIGKEVGRAAILEINPATGHARVYASGMRNPVGMALEPESGELWVVVNERDELGSDLVPDYLTFVKDGGFYGWPYSYFGHHVDMRVKPQDPKLVARAIAPDYALGNHVAPLGLVFARGVSLPAPFKSGAFVGEHGSWNRNPLSGYQVVFIPFKNGKPNGNPIEVLTGFVDENGDARGRPVGVAIDGRGGLLVADDVGNTVWRVVAAGRAPD